MSNPTILALVAWLKSSPDLWAAALGLFLVAAGLVLISVPAALIVTGLLLVGLSVFGD